MKEFDMPALEPGVNFTNVLPECFSFKSKFCSFSLITDQLWDFLAKGYRQKTHMLNVGEIDPGVSRIF
jgi:hypothetical protein